MSRRNPELVDRSSGPAYGRPRRTTNWLSRIDLAGSCDGAAYVGDADLDDLGHAIKALPSNWAEHIDPVPQRDVRLSWRDWR